jgi:hypothetical protein
MSETIILFAPLVPFMGHPQNSVNALRSPLRAGGIIQFRKNVKCDSSPRVDMPKGLLSGLREPLRKQGVRTPCRIAAFPEDNPC